jgi:hypothetical protein
MISPGPGMYLKLRDFGLFFEGQIAQPPLIASALQQLDFCASTALSAVPGQQPN